MARIASNRLAKARSGSPRPRKTDASVSAANRRGKSEGHIPRPPNAFILFRQELNKKSVSAGEAHQKSISSVACALWRKYRDEEPARLAKYFELAEKLKEDHKARYPDYVYRPRKRVGEKKKRQSRTSIQEEEQRKQAVFAAHTGAGLSSLSTPPTRSSTRSTRSKKAVVKSESEDDVFTRLGFSSPETVTSWLDSPDAFKSPTLSSTPSSSPSSIISPLLSTPLDLSVSQLPMIPIGSSTPYDSLIQLPADFSPCLQAPIELQAMFDPVCTNELQWNGLGISTGPQISTPEMSFYDVQQYSYDVNVSDVLKPFCEDQFLSGYTPVPDMTQYIGMEGPTF